MHLCIRPNEMLIETSQLFDVCSNSNGPKLVRIISYHNKMLIKTSQLFDVCPNSNGPKLVHIISYNISYTI